MAERGGFTFQPRGQGSLKRQGRGRGRGRGRGQPGWGVGKGRVWYQSTQNPIKLGQPPHRPNTGDGLNPEDKQLSQRERFHTLLKLEVGISSKACTKEEVLSPGSSSSSKRSCTEMEDNDENKAKVLIKKRCKKNLAGTFPSCRDGDGVSKGKLPGDEVTAESTVIMSKGEDWDEEIRTAELKEKKIAGMDAADWDYDDGRTDINSVATDKIDGLMLVQESYPSSGSNGTEPSKNQDVGLLINDDIKQLTPKKVMRDKVVDCLSSAVTENCTCTSEEDTCRSPEEQQNHSLNIPRGVRSFSSPTAGSRMRPCTPSKSKSDSWTYSVFKEGSVKKKGKLKKKHRVASIPEYQSSTDDDIEPSPNKAFQKGEKAKNCRPKKGINFSSNSLRDAEMKGSCAEGVIEKNDEIEVGLFGPDKQANCQSKSAEDDGDSCQADDSLTDDENWNNVVKKLSADGVDAEEVQERPELPPEMPEVNDQTNQSPMDAPLSFRQDFRARFSYPPPTYMAYDHNHPSMRPSFPYGPPMWPMMGNPYFYGPAMMRGFHPDALARYPVVHRFPRCIPSQVHNVPADPVRSPSSDCQDSFFTADESTPESRDYMHSMSAAFDMNAYGGTDYVCQEKMNCKDNEYGEEVFYSDFDSSGNQSYISHDLGDETWRQDANVSWEKKTPLLPTPLPDVQEDTENLDTQSSFISTEDESCSYFPSPSEPAPRAEMSDLTVEMDMESKEQPSHNWYNHGMETPASGVVPARRKSKVWGLSLKQMTRDPAGQKHEETRSQVPVPSNPLCVSPQPPSSYAAVVSARTGTEHSDGQKKVTHISSAHLEERRRGSYPGVTAPQSGWGSGHSLIRFVSPQNDSGITKENPQEKRFWQGTPSPVSTDATNKYRSWSAGSQGWGTYNITPVPRPVSAPPKPKTFAEIVQRPRRLTLEDEVRGETLPKLTSWRSSTEIEDKIEEIQYPSSDIDYLDTHAHIDLLFQRHMFKGTFAKFCLDNKFPTNFAGCVAIFCYPFNFSNHYSLADNLLKESNIWGSFGCHPHQVKHYDGIMEQKIKDWMDHPKTVALGEIGLDYSDRPLETTSDHELQKMIFRRQLQVALDTKKPLVIHCRDAEADTLSIMSEMVPRNHKIHRHCFTGPPQDAITFLRAFPNSFIGLTALVTFPTATNTHQTARAIPLNRLLLETDTPYFVPRKVRGHRWSHPGMALLVAERIAQLRGTTLDDVLAHVRANTMTMYGI